jgi:DegV family protein with EDD domain
MRNACIVTDGSVQLPKPNFIGRNLINILPFEIHYNGRIFSERDPLRAQQLPKIASELHKPHLISPDQDRLWQLFTNLSAQYETIYAIFISKELAGVYQNACEAAESLKGKVQISVIDSKTTSVGLGILIQNLVNLIISGEDQAKIERKLRSLISHTYTLICVPSLSYLHFNGFIEETQSIISQMLGMIPIFTLEDGALSPIEKVKNHRHAISYFQEFVEEFEKIDHIAFVQSAKPNFKDAKTFHDSITAEFPSVIFTKHLINLPLAILFGPKSNSLFVLETC